MSDSPVVANSEGEAVLEAPIRVREEWKQAKSTEGVVCQTHVGGQALIEGIMMRGRYNWAVAVREPKGTVYLEEHDLGSGKDKNSWLRKPVVRGCTALVESLALGYQALEIAAQHAFDPDEFEDEEPADEGAPAPPILDSEGVSLDSDLERESSVTVLGTEDCLSHEAASSAGERSDGTFGTRVSGDDTPSESPLPKSLITISMIVGLLLGIGIFVVLPAVITNLIVGDYADKTLLWNIVDGLLRIAIFIFYIWLIGRMKDIKRMFSYHGAEHKTIHCYEHGLELTVENARKFPTLHVRCGTAFMLMTMIIAIFVFTVVPVGPLIDAMGVTNGVVRLILVIISRIILLPVVAGLSYELTVKWAGGHPENPFVQFVLWPGMQMQRLTTNQPDDGMLECAIAAMRLVLEREEREAAALQVKAEGAGTI
jgi:uncharacterized protein YqhQ